MTQKTANEYAADIRKQMITLEILGMKLKRAGMEKGLVVKEVDKELVQLRTDLGRFERLQSEMSNIQNKVRKLMFEELSEESKTLMRSYELEESFFGSYLQLL